MSYSRSTFRTKTVESDGHPEEHVILKKMVLRLIKEPSFVIFPMNFYEDAQIAVLSQRAVLNSPGRLSMAYACSKTM